MAEVLIVAGWLRVDPDDRDDYLQGCVETVEAARTARGCLDFQMSADLIDAGRISIHERWDHEDDMVAFRGSGPSEDQQIAILDAQVLRYEVSSEGPA